MEILAHRGVPFEYPENTLPSFEEALKCGFGIETDIRRTKDGQLVLSHDQNIKRATGVDKNIGESTLEELNKYNFKYIFPNAHVQICTLEELVGLYKKYNMGSNSGLPRENFLGTTPEYKVALHIKTTEATEETLRDVAELILKNNLQDSFFIFDLLLPTAKTFKEKYPQIHISISVGEKRYAPSIYLLEDIKEESNSGLPRENFLGTTPEYKNSEGAMCLDYIDSIWADEWCEPLYSKAFFDEIKAMGKPSYVISPELHIDHNHPLGKKGFEKVWNNLIEWGVGGICTDYPKEFAKNMEKLAAQSAAATNPKMNNILPSIYKNEKVLVTGGAGFVGSNVVEKLLEAGALVTVLDNFSRGEESWRNIREVTEKGSFNIAFGDIMDFELVKREVANASFVFHFAALPSHRLALKDPRSYAIADVVGTVNVLEAVRLLTNKPKILFASSNKVYGKQTPPFKEELIPQPEGPYGLAKANAEQWCRLYHEYYQVPVIIVRLHHIVGPRSQPDLALSIFTEQAFNNESLTVHGRKTQEGFLSCSAAFTNIHDAVEGMLRAMAYTADFEIFNIGAEKETTVKKLAELVQTEVGVSLPIVEKEMYQHESLHHAADARKSRDLLQWEALTPVEESVRQYVTWRKKVGVRSSAVYKEG